MRVGVVFFGAGKRDTVAEIARGIVKGLEKQGHQVDLIDGDRDRDAKLTIYGYVAIGTVSRSLFGGRIDQRIAEYLSGSGMLGGKRTFAFVARSPFGAQKALSRLMKTLEHEGMFIRFSEILRSRTEAELVGSRLKVEP